MSDEPKMDREELEQGGTFNEGEKRKSGREIKKMKGDSPAGKSRGERYSGVSSSAHGTHSTDKEGNPADSATESKSPKEGEEMPEPTSFAAADSGDDKKQVGGGEDEEEEEKTAKERDEAHPSEGEVPPEPKDYFLEESGAPQSGEAPEEERVPRGLYEELNDRFLRVVADFENYKKRVMKEKADIMAYGNEQLIKELLTVVDNLERALQHSEPPENDSSVVAGIKLVHRQFMSVLDKFGVKPIEVKMGEKFDPRFHHAIEHVAASEITPGLVLSEILKGYTLNDKLLRPALVAVSKPEENGDDET